MVEEKPPRSGSSGSSKKTSKNSSNGTEARPEDVQEAKRGLLKAMWEASVAPRFSSKPIDMEDYFNRESFAHQSSGLSDTSFVGNSTTTQGPSIRNSLVSSKNLTSNEQIFLENLLQSEDLDSIRKASVRLADKDLFPPSMSATVGNADDMHTDSGKEPEPLSTIDSAGRKLERRESLVQQGLYRLHESGSVRPSTALRRMSTLERERRNSSRSSLPPVPRNNSLTNNSTHEDTTARQTANSALEAESSWDMQSDGESPSEVPLEESKPWNPFGDINSWIDGNQGVEVDGEGVPDIPAPTSNPFKILGTSADDVSAHPHVLTPPLMEGLQQFMPETLHEYHFWLKYSLVRDGRPLTRSSAASVNNSPLYDMLRHCRASQHTVLAIETTDGHVFGAFCSQAWKLQADSFWGSEDSFLWRMRHSRNEPCETIVQQVLMESKLDIFPFTGINSQIQRYTAGEGLVLGEGELTPDPAATTATTTTLGEHYGNALRLDPSMKVAWTSTSGTFGNPSLVHTDMRGEKVEIANVEMWALTPHTSIESAITLEMNQLFLAETQGTTDKNLGLFEILVGGPV